jgi:hypothetical protein
MADGVTPILLFSLGLLAIVPFALVHLFLRLRRSRGPDPSLDQSAQRVERLIRRLLVLPLVGGLAFVAWIAIAAWAHVLADLRSEALLLLGFLWLLIVPLLGLRLLAASLRGGRPRSAGGVRSSWIRR